MEVIPDLDRGARPWLELQSHDPITTPYQNYEFLKLWFQEAGQLRGVTPCVVAAHDAADRLLVVLPLGLCSTGPVRVLSFLGGKHANFNFGIWRRDTAPAFTATDLDLLLRQVAASPLRPDLLTLCRQPASWQGVANPLLLLPHQIAPNSSAKITFGTAGVEAINREISTAMRGRLRTKERKLRALEGYRYHRVTEPADVDRLLDQFFAVKTVHMAAQGLPNVFAEPGVVPFLRAACHHGLAAGHPLIELHALEGGGELLALFGGIVDGRRFSGMINTYTLSDKARHSPGLILILHMLNDYAQRGYESFDLGVGAAQYKSFFCKEPEPLFDSFVPLTPLGRLAAVGVRSAASLIRSAKRAPMLWNALQAVRRQIGPRN